MKSLTRVLHAPNAIAIVKEGDEEVVLRVRECSMEVQPFSAPHVKLDCVYHERENRDAEKKVSVAMRKKKVIYAPPATVVLWEDGTKTVVKCDERDTYDAKYGLALCYMKKALGNTSRALNDVLHGEAISDD